MKSFSSAFSQHPHSLEKKAYISSRESSEHSEIRLSNGGRGTRGVPKLSGSLVGDEGFEFSEPPSNYRTGGGLTGISLRAAVQARMVLALAEGPKIPFKMNVRAVSPHVPNYLVPDWIAFLVWHLFVRCPLVRLSSINVDRELSLRNAMGTAFFVRFQLCYIDALPCERKHHM